MKWILPLLILCPLFLFTLPHFNPQNLYTEIPNGSDETAPIAALLDQKFTYLGEGAQVYAFVSEDGKTVLKLFKARHQRPFKFSHFLRRLRHTANDKEISGIKWRVKFQDSTRRYKEAFIHLKDETGLIFIHFQKSRLPLLVTLKDKYTYEVDLSQYPFILQKKAFLISEYLRKFPEKKEQAKQALKEFFITRLEKGFSDPRQSLGINYGFIGDLPIQIDVGKIEPFEGDKETEIAKIHARVEKWITSF